MKSNRTLPWEASVGERDDDEQIRPNAALQAQLCRGDGEMPRHVAIFLWCLGALRAVVAGPAEESDKIPVVYHAIPRIQPNDRYRRHLGRIFVNAAEDAGSKSQARSERIVGLEKQNLKLRRKIAALSEALGDSENGRVAEAKELEKEKRQLQDDVDVAAHQPPIHGGLPAGQQPRGFNDVPIKDSSLQITGETVETMLFLGVILATQLFLMLHSQSVTVRCMTWMMLEMATATVMAGLWFHAIDDVFEWSGWTRTRTTVAALLNAMIVYCIFLLVAWRLRHKEELLWTVTACGAQFIGFSAMYAGSQINETFFSSHVLFSFLSVVILLLICCFVSLVGHWAIGRAERYEQDITDLPMDDQEDFSRFIEKIDELEDDIAGLALAFVWTLSVRYLISGAYAGMEEGETGSMQHTSVQRLVLFIYTASMAALAVFSLPRLQHFGQKVQSPLGKRLLLMLHPFLAMSVAWAVLLWADWTFYEWYFRDATVLGRVWFAFLAGFCVLGIIFVMAHLQRREMHENRSSDDKLERDHAHQVDLHLRWSDLERRKFILGMMALIVAFAWLQTYDKSLDGSYSGAGMVNWKTLIKLVDAAVLTAVLLPIYIWYLQPKIAALEEEEDEMVGLDQISHSS